MKERRDFIKACAAGAALTLPGVVSAQNSPTLAPVISMVLFEKQFVLEAAASSSVVIAVAEATI